MYKQNVVDVSNKMKDDSGIDETLKIIEGYLASKY
jgi:hypothetical protein